jgi:hypothetical protein
MAAGREGVEVSTFGQPALDEPTLYPGPTPEHSYLLLGNEVLRLVPTRGTLGGWLVGEARLDGVLSEAGAAPAEGRTAVLAYGSNASPPQLVRKFAALPHSAVPVVKALAFGLRLTFSAHINPLGYVPAALRSGGEESRLRTWVTFLDDEQLRILDATEPSYHRVVVAYGGDRPVVELESGELLKACALYRTRWGVLDLEACDDKGLITQLALKAALEAHSPALDSLFGPSEVIRPARTLFADISEISGLGLVTEDGLDDLIVAGSARYGRIRI